MILAILFGLGLALILAVIGVIIAEIEAEFAAGEYMRERARERERDLTREFASRHEYADSVRRRMDETRGDYPEIWSEVEKRQRASEWTEWRSD